MEAGREAVLGAAAVEVAAAAAAAPAEDVAGGEFAEEAKPTEALKPEPEAAAGESGASTRSEQGRASASV